MTTARTKSSRSPRRTSTRSTSAAKNTSQTQRKQKSPRRPGAAKEAAKIAAALLLAQGVGTTAIAEEHGVIGRTTLWRLLNKDTDEARAFQAYVEELREQMATKAAETVMGEQVQKMRDLAPLVIEAWEKGLRSDAKFTKVKVVRWIPQGEGEPSIREETWEAMPLPDVGLAVHTADIVSKRYPEMVPRSKTDVEVTGSWEMRLAQLDAEDSAGTS